MPVCHRTPLQNHSYSIPLDTKHNLQEMSGKHVHCVLLLCTILRVAMSKIHTTISPGEDLPHLGSKRKQMNTCNVKT